MQPALTTLQNAVNNLTSSPQNAEHQNTVATSQATLVARSEAMGKSMTPAQVDMLQEISGGEMLGPALGKWVTQWILGNAMTPAVARDEIASLAQKRAAILAALEETQVRLGGLGVKEEEPPEGEAELGF